MAYNEDLITTLSSNILAYFGDIKDEDISKTYQGDFTNLKALFSNKYALVKKPEGLVQKIDKDRIKELTEELKAKK